PRAVRVPAGTHAHDARCVCVARRVGSFGSTDTSAKGGFAWRFANGPLRCVVTVQNAVPPPRRRHSSRELTRSPSARSRVGGVTPDPPHNRWYSYSRKPQKYARISEFSIGYHRIP